MEKNSKPIVTGQQIGILGGPLYTTYKVLSAIFYADEKKINSIYWLETNDADFEEINKIHFINKHNCLKTLKWEKNTGGLCTGEVVVDNTLIQLLTKFFDEIVQTDYTDNLKNIVFSSYKTGDKLKTCSLKLAQQLFSPFKLNYFEPTDKNFRDFSKEILLKEAYSTENGNQCNLFAVENGIRKAVFKKENKFVFRNGETVDIKNSILVPNLQTRNICQDAYFNTDTYIAGLGEVSYIEKLDSMYKKHSVKKANVKKRMFLTLVEPKTVRLLKKTGLTLEEIEHTDKQNLEKLIVAKEHNVDFGKLTKEALLITKNYLSSLENLGINTKEMKKYLISNVKENLGNKRAKTKALIKNKIENSITLSNLLYPYGKKQERVFNIFYYMNLYGGTEFIKFLYNNTNLESKILEIKND